jgi:hypothetical protein
VLVNRRILEPTLRHEFTHVLADAALSGRPAWVREGLAVHIAGESGAAGGERAARPSGPPRSCPADEALRSAVSMEAWRRAYDEAGQCVARALAAGARWQDLR